MVFVMPDGNNASVYDVLTGLLKEDLFKLFGEMKEENVELHLPRTTVEFADSDFLNFFIKEVNIQSYSLHFYSIFMYEY